MADAAELNVAVYSVKVVIVKMRNIAHLHAVIKSTFK